MEEFDGEVLEIIGRVFGHKERGIFALGCAMGGRKGGRGEICV